MNPLSKILFVRSAHEAYPEIAAYRSVLSNVYETEEGDLSILKRKNGLDAAILWMIMGFYPRRPAAGMVIHDYRSLSVGRLRRIKDCVKRALNAQPDARIFQNDDIRTMMDFQDGIPSFLLPMGVPSFVLQHRRRADDSTHGCDFCYIGAMSAERRTQEMLDSFVRRFGRSRTFHLYGMAPRFLIDRYRAFPNIVFQGRKGQGDVFDALVRARVAVNYFPTHPPHTMQTPTKLLEYAALGLRVLSNEQPSSRQACARYGFFSQWGPAQDMFAGLPDALDWPDNTSFNPSPLLWPNVIASSGVIAFLKERGSK